MSFSDFWNAIKNPDSPEAKAYREELKRKQTEHHAEARKQWKEGGGWEGIFSSITEKTKEWEEKNHPERREWREKLLNFVSNPNTLDELTDDELESYKIIAKGELKRFEEAAKFVNEGGKNKGHFDGSESIPIFFSGTISWNEIHVLTTLVERNEKLIELINARQESRKNRPPKPADKKEQKQKREEDLYQKLSDLKTRRERLIKIETGGKPIEEWTEEEHRKVKRWENSIEAEEERIREELSDIWESL